MRRDYPVSADAIPLSGTSWFAMDYDLKINPVGIEYFTAKENCEVRKYSPVEPRSMEKQPERPERWEEIPHIHLARVDTEKLDSILKFINRWGLLGLWKVEGYRYLTGMLPDVGRSEDGDFSMHYINPVVDGKKSRNYHHKFREPLSAVIRAVKEYQDFFQLLEGDTDDKTEAEAVLNKYLADCRPTAWYLGDQKGWESHWDSPSLLHSCYLLNWFDIAALKNYIRCGHKPCNKIFIATREKTDYCSVRCQKNAKRLRNYYK